MPIYEYACKKCETKFDHLARTMSSREEDQGVKCPSCGSIDTSRALSVFAVASDASKPAADPMCGRCGGAPGSCQMG